MDGFGRVTAAAEAADGRHAGVVPAADEAFLDEGEQVALAHQGVAQVQLVELVLARTVVVQVVAFLQPVDEEVVERAVYDELQRAERVGHAFEEVALPVGEVIHRVGFPLRARAVVRMLHDAVDDGVAEVHVRVGHVNLGAEHHGAFFNLARVHLPEKLQVLLDGAVAVGAFRARLGGRAFLGGNLFGSLLVHVGFAFLDEADGEVPQLLEVVRSIVFVPPLVSQPADVFLDGLDVFHVLLRRVGVVEAQVAHASVGGKSRQMALAWPMCR